MRENSSVNDKMIDRNWVKTRKRKRLPCGLDLSNGKESSSLSLESPRSNTSARRRLKVDFNLSRSAQKKKGNDGYYFECVICDLGGNLLCCDSCPRTYHLQCLNPPLKRTPPGKWQCPNCCKSKDSFKLISHPETISRRARTKITVEKTKTRNKSSGSDKLSLFIRSSIPGKNRSSSKAKIASSRTVHSVEKKTDSPQMGVSLIMKSDHSSDGGFTEGISTCADTEIEKKTSLPCRDASLERKSGSQEEVQTSIRISNSDPKDELSEMKSDLQCNNVSQENKLVPTPDSSSKKPRERKQKINEESKKKMSKADKGKGIMTVFSKCGAKETSALSEKLKLRKKRSTINESSISKEDSAKKNVASQVKGKRLSEDTLQSPHVLDESVVKADKITHERNDQDGVQQVDRILGCRAQSCEVPSLSYVQPVKLVSFPISTEPDDPSLRLASGQPSHDLLDLECHSRPSESDHHLAGIRVVDVIDTEKFHVGGSHFTTNQEDNGVDNLNTDMTHANGLGEVDVLTSIEKTLKDQALPTNKSKILEEPILCTVDTGEVTTKEVHEDNINVDLVDSGPVCLLPESCDTRDDETILEKRASDSAKIKISETLLNESAPINSENIRYEFLVKWVGQSHIHNTWVSESHLKVLAKRKLENYKAKYGIALINIFQEQWSQPQRIIALRSMKDGTGKALVKWRGLPYDECTWERLDEPIIKKSAHLISEFEEFERRTFNKVASEHDMLRTKADHQQREVVTLVEQPEELKGGSLFPHQLEALNWLRKCWHKSKNVILADEMGLGKTVSACAFLSSLYFEFEVRLPCLVLVPLSTMPNWLAEFGLWAPHLNVVEYHGSAKARSVIRQYEWHASDQDEKPKKTLPYKFNVLLTTYEMVLADSSHLRVVPWEVLVVDEGHRLKNSGSKLFNMLNTFSFQHRVLLTGTPLQNNIGEMYNLLNFLQPVSFPSLSSFEERFNDLTTAEKVEELKKLVAPHMLRRLKKDAMQNIPPKTERIVPVELSSIQAEYYRAMLTKNYQILRNIGKGVAQQSMLNIVMQLRKVCNHPYLIPGTEPDSGSMEFLQEMRIKASAKLSLLHSMLKVLNKEGHRVLIFSQMTKLLDILEDYLTVEFGSKTFERVDGSVSVADRQAAIARFNQDKTRFVFLLSTRSCGLGINLATADTVIIYDSDFNPHADIQAMNRAHRIGQSNRLLVYRLVVRASVEERILQLAKKKLMLDQLFVNKSGSQKEVEDILRWGTEELFSDSATMSGKDSNGNTSGKTEVAAETEQRHKRRGGGLGDVYKDRCTEGSTKNVWDENAILRLLDRSYLPLGSADGTEGDLENDMLGSVKSVEWNDEPNEEQGGTELLPSTAGDVCAQSSEKKEDHVVNNTEENEWDRLLRLRWERYQNEEEAALGRGKRLRKAVSYKEAFAQHLNGALTETGNEEEPELEPEPEPEYTPAGRALKAKYAKLRARQKERLAQRYTVDASRSLEDQGRHESSPKFPTTPNREVGPSLAGRDTDPAFNLEDTKSLLLSDAPKSRTNSTTRLGRFTKHGYKSCQSSHLDLSARPPATLTPDMFLPSHCQSTCSGSSVTANNLLPVLGLCAPNANQPNSTGRYLKSYLNLPKSNCEQSKTGMGLSDFPFRLTANTSPVDERETVVDNSKVPDTSAGVLHCHLKNTIQDSCLPFSPFPSATTSQGMFPDSLGSSGLFPSLSLGMQGEAAHESGRDLVTMPLLPNLRQSRNDNQKQKQHVREASPVLGPDQMQGSYSSLPEKHKRVLENIMMKTGSGTTISLKKRSKVVAWSEDELDALWIGVRRHGKGHWDTMLRDPNLKFSKCRTSEDLSNMWEEEQLKILDVPSFPLPKSSKSTFSEISDGMMTRALFENRFAGLGTEHYPRPKFRSHLTDIQLGYRDLSSSMPYMDPINHFSIKNDLYSSFPFSKHEKLIPSVPEDYSAGPSDRPADLNLPLEHTFLPNSLVGSSLGSLSMNCSTSYDLKRKEEEQCADRYLKLPSLLDRSLNWLRDCHNNRQGGESSTGLFAEHNRSLNSGCSSPKDGIAGSSSTSNKLPHWLREAVGIPKRPSESDLPPNVSAIAHSVRLLYGEEKPAIPPFTLPGPPPFQPRDPRRNMKKKRKLHKHRRLTPEMVTSTKNFQSSVLGDNIASSSIPPAPPLPLLPPSTGVFPWTEPKLSLPSLNMNSNSPSSSLFPPHRKKGMTLSPSPEVLHLVASCVAPGPRLSPAPGMQSSCVLQCELPAAKSFEPFESLPGSGSLDLKGGRGKRKAGSSLLGRWEQLSDKRVDQTVESGDSSKTQSDPCRLDRPEVEEVSSEETVSDDRRSEH